MRFLLIVTAVLSLATSSTIVSAQSWTSAVAQGHIQLNWARAGDQYTFTISNPVNNGKNYQVIADMLQPFNLPSPAEVICPAGWTWNDNGGWNHFELSKSNQKYLVDGPALEPGETLQFVYVAGGDTGPVNPGGPGGSNPAFLSHVMAVDGQQDGKWIPTMTQFGKTWYDTPTAIAVATNTPEPSGLMIISSSIFMFACLARKRVRV